MGIQSSINTALGVAAIASGLTNKKQVDRAQDKLDKSEEKLTNTEKDLAKTTAEKNEVINQQAEDAKLDLKAYEQLKNNMYSGGKTNIDNADDKIDIINNSTNDIKGPSINDFLNSLQKPDPYAVEQIMGFRAIKMLNSRIAAKREIINRSKRAMISPQARAAREAKEDGTYSMKLDQQTMRTLKTKEDGTYSFRNGRLVKENLKSGYQVSFFRPEITDENIQSLLKKIGNKLGPAYIGVYGGSPEISYSFKDKDKAMEFARAFNQYSIWDHKEGKEIRNDKYNENARVDYNIALDNFAKALNNKINPELEKAKNGGNK